ncbi:hypothetical protein NSK_006236 [Nannochloropsis salina CCMP1776]|uniref:Uncharacterized protein n=1 Tax=Nannochloropsis salina CCMP1776 TaxID=1027361 RepID=A0A4D9CTA4_9STRA|nr:hypothetical protein NSK_006236 [Nannochloropsis salina CCMP1776]|eukprot:TFJ82461.1 hypothetical protein NSK_006236 [Nannochloropsis salina CCMP1776]
MTSPSAMPPPPPPAQTPAHTALDSSLSETASRGKEYRRRRSDPLRSGVIFKSDYLGALQSPLPRIALSTIPRAPVASDAAPAGLNGGGRGGVGERGEGGLAKDGGEEGGKGAGSLPAVCPVPVYTYGGNQVFDQLCQASPMPKCMRRVVGGQEGGREEGREEGGVVFKPPIRVSGGSWGGRGQEAKREGGKEGEVRREDEREKCGGLEAVAPPKEEEDGREDGREEGVEEGREEGMEESFVSEWGGTPLPRRTVPVQAAKSEGGGEGGREEGREGEENTRMVPRVAAGKAEERRKEGGGRRGTGAALVEGRGGGGRREEGGAQRLSSPPTRAVELRRGHSEEKEGRQGPKVTERKRASLQFTAFPPPTSSATSRPSSLPPSLPPSKRRRGRPRGGHWGDAVGAREGGRRQVPKKEIAREASLPPSLPPALPPALPPSRPPSPPRRKVSSLNALAGMDFPSPSSPSPPSPPCPPEGGREGGRKEEKEEGRKARLEGFICGCLVGE